MKNRKKGFSLVELLIVLAVMAALIATITPVALNAIKKSKATQVGQNMKTLSSAFENALYVNDEVPSFTDLGRDIDKAKYDVVYTTSNGVYTVAVLTSDPVDEEALKGVLKDAAKGDYTKISGMTSTGNTLYTGTTQYHYAFTFATY